MAKGNLFLGTAAKSVGDVVMYRRDGSQVSRVRVRKIANPKTDAQCEQRAFMSAVVKFYQPLANVLDRSWQGMSRAKSYAKFLKTNVGIVRTGGYYLPKGTGFYPLPLQVSEGTLQSFAYSAQGNAAPIILSGITQETTTPTTVGALSTLFIGNGSKSGDVITIILVGVGSDDVMSERHFQFEVDSTSATPISDILPYGYILEVNTSESAVMIKHNTMDIIGIAVIGARNVDGVWQRSKQTMSVMQSVLTLITTNTAKAAAIASYKGAAASDNPLVYLDGDELDNA